jgi:hypothetical protein
MNITQNIISRAEALKLAPDYVAFVEGDFDKFNVVDEKFSKLKKGQVVITYSHNEKVFVKAKVSKVDHSSFQAIDGPVIRVSNGEWSWRVDGSGYAWPLKG